MCSFSRLHLRSPRSLPSPPIPHPLPRRRPPAPARAPLPSQHRSKRTNKPRREVDGRRVSLEHRTPHLITSPRSQALASQPANRSPWRSRGWSRRHCASRGAPRRGGGGGGRGGPRVPARCRGAPRPRREEARRRGGGREERQRRRSGSSSCSRGGAGEGAAEEAEARAS